MAKLHVVSVLALCACACSSSRSDPTALARQPIVGGQPTSNGGVVAIAGRGLCTGALVAPNLVLTAKHCVAEVTGGPYACDENGGLIEFGSPGAGSFGDTVPAADLVISEAGSVPNGTPVGQILVSSAASVCAGDIAALVLEEPVDDPSLMALRLSSAPAVGDQLTATGWGYTEGESYATELQARTVTVDGVGPTPEAGAGGSGGGPISYIPPGYVSTTEGPCHGDSGSPALAPSGASVGVLSFIFRSTESSAPGTAADCVDAGAGYVTLAAQQPFIVSAFGAAGATPWLEGQPDPRAGLGAFEAACTGDADCKSNICLAGSDGTERCSRACAFEACPQGYQCTDFDGHMRCQQMAPPPAPAEPPDSSGCALARAPAAGARAPWLLVGLAVGHLHGRRRGRNAGRGRRERPGHSPHAER
jgi:hypothetical protein